MAASGRLYTVAFSNVTISAVQDLFGIYSQSKVVALQKLSFGQITGTTAFNARLRIRYVPATVTSGSGGGAGTINKTANGDASATATARINDTTQATSSGTVLDMEDEVWNTINNYVWYPAVPGHPLMIPVSSALIISLDTALASYVCNGTCMFEEFP